MEEIVTNSSTYNNIPSKPSSSSSSFERRVIIRSSSTATKAAPHVNCPRCDSTNTKFCYYNNYSLSQPRYFCKTCRRYWTEGGTLRNIPVGGGSRKNKRSSSSSSSSYSSLVSKKLNDSDDLFVVPPASTSVLSQNPRIHQQHHHQGHYGHFNYGQDLNLGFPSSTTSSSISTTTTGSAQLSAMELLNGITTRGGITTTTTTATTRMNSFMPIPIPIQDPNSVYSSSSGAELMIPMMPEFKIPSSLGFSLDGMASGSGGYGNSSSTTTAGGGILFPFEEVKTNTQTTDHEDGLQSRDHHQNGDSNGFWNGMLGGGSW